MTTNNYIYRVRFHEKVNGKYNHYFSSLAAIYTVFSREEIGCDVSNLWNLDVAKGKLYSNRKCVISKNIVYRKKHEK